MEFSCNYNDLGEIKQIVVKEFENFDLKEKWPSFCGGKFKTGLPGVWAHIDNEGHLRRIEINKPAPNHGVMFIRVS